MNLTSACQMLFFGSSLQLLVGKNRKTHYSTVSITSSEVRCTTAVLLRPASAYS